MFRVAVVVSDCESPFKLVISSGSKGGGGGEGVVSVLSAEALACQLTLTAVLFRHLKGERGG